MKFIVKLLVTLFIWFLKVLVITMFIHLFQIAVGSSVSGLSGLYAVTMRAAGASRRVFQLLDRVSSMPKSGNQCPLGLVY